MDAGMIKAWNSVITPRDEVFHLGDFAHRCPVDRLERIFGRLNGVKRLVVGNHDDKATRELGWASVNDIVTLKIDGTDVVLCHYPMREWAGSNQGSIHFFGHSHNRMPSSGRAIDVGVDSLGFVPQTYEQIRARMVQLPSLDFAGVETVPLDPDVPPSFKR